MKSKSDIGSGDFKPVDKIKNIFYLISTLGTGFLIIYFLASVGLQMDKSEVEKIKASGSETIGKIIKIGSMKGSYAIAEYHVNSTRYERKDGSPADDIFIGEYYKVVFDSLDPSESRIDYARPVFLKNQLTENTNGRIVSADWAKFKFLYLVNGVEFNRFQKIPQGKNINIGQVFSAEYLTSNPQIAILKIE